MIRMINETKYVVSGKNILYIEDEGVMVIAQFHEEDLISDVCDFLNQKKDGK